LFDSACSSAPISKHVPIEAKAWTQARGGRQVSAPPLNEKKEDNKIEEKKEIYQTLRMKIQVFKKNYFSVLNTRAVSENGIKPLKRKVLSNFGAVPLEKLAACAENWLPSEKPWQRS
jgi:hypothetical protein